LRGREDVHFEHADWVWAYGSIPDLVDPEFGD
jgi:hypothetical protein